MGKTKKSRACPKPPRSKIFNRQRDLVLSLSHLRGLVCRFLDRYNLSDREVFIYLVSERYIILLHQQFFNDPTPTDCISFPLNDETLGEVFVCPKAALAYKNPYEEVALYIIHGLLHLIGYDDREPKEKRLMRKKEREMMNACRDIITELRSK